IDTASSTTTDWSLENRIDVSATWTTLTLDSGLRTQLEIGATGTLDPVLGAVTVSGQVGDVLLVADQNSSAGQPWTVTPSTIRRGPVGGLITYSGLDQVDIDGGAGDDAFVVSGTAAATRTSIFAGGGNDVFEIRGPAAGWLGLYGGTG